MNYLLKLSTYTFLALGIFGFVYIDMRQPEHLVSLTSALPHAEAKRGHRDEQETEAYLPPSYSTTQNTTNGTSCRTVYDTTTSPSGRSTQTPRQVCDTATPTKTEPLAAPVKTPTAPEKKIATPTVIPSAETTAKAAPKVKTTVSTPEAVPQTPSLYTSVFSEPTPAENLTATETSALEAAYKNIFLKALWDIKQILLGLLAFGDTTALPTSTPVQTQTRTAPAKVQANPKVIAPKSKPATTPVQTPRAIDTVTRVS